LKPLIYFLACTFSPAKLIITCLGLQARLEAYR
jgi:hypothetical protein